MHQASARKQAHGGRFRQGLVMIALLLGLESQVVPLVAGDKLDRFEFVQIRMGIPVRILVYAEQQTAANQAAEAAFERIRQIDQALSDYDPDSEIRRLASQHPVGTPVPASDDLLTVACAAKDLSSRSGGAFDVTIGPVVKLWRIARRKHALPDPDKVREALSQTGDQWLLVDPKARTVTLKQPGMQLDFGGIAKGYAADEAYKVLVDHHLPIALVAAAGDIRVGNPPPGTSGWRVEVEDKTQPAGTDRKPRILILANQGVSTSGDTYQFLEIDGVRYSHLVDPKTGLGLTTPGSVSILAPTAMQADGLASAVSVLGPERGLELIARTPETEALMVYLDQNGVRQIRQSAHWPGDVD